MQRNICVFASSSNKLDKKFYAEAAKLGKLLGENNYNIVYGGSRLGIMYACAAAVKEAGGNIVGIMPEKLYNVGVGNPEDCEQFYLTKGMRERKAKMDETSTGVIALAGGFGTLEELSEMIVQKQLGYNNKPIIILNTNHFYDKLIEFFETIIDSNFAKKETSKIYYIADTPEEVITYLNHYDEKEVTFSGKF